MKLEGTGDSRQRSYQHKPVVLLRLKEGVSCLLAMNTLAWLVWGEIPDKAGAMVPHGQIAVTMHSRQGTQAKDTVAKGHKQRTKGHKQNVQDVRDTSKGSSEGGRRALRKQVIKAPNKY
jgi:hypothetical protein